MSDHYAILDAVRNLHHLIRESDDETLNKALQEVATWTNNSYYAHTHEPLSGITVAMQSEFRRRVLDVDDGIVSDESEES